MRSLTLEVAVMSSVLLSESVSLDRSAHSGTIVTVPLPDTVVRTMSVFATGASFTAVTVNDTLPVSVLKSSAPLVWPLSRTV